MLATHDQEEAKARVRDKFARFLQAVKERNGLQFDADVMQRARLVDATTAGMTLFELDVGEQYSNSGGIMHGGAAALILDMFTTTAFIPMAPLGPKGNEFLPPGGMTRAMNMTYLRPLPLPAKIRIKANVVQNGRSVSLVCGNIASVDGKKVYFTCEHHKVYSSNSHPTFRNVAAKKTKL